MFGRDALTPEPRDLDRVLALNYVPFRMRAHVLALWSLDETLGRIVQTTTEPMIGQMRLTWWHERLCALGREQAAATPLLAACAALCAASTVTGATLAALVEGWEALLDPLPLTDDAIALHAVRGRTLFAIMASLLGGDHVACAGEGWAAMDLSVHCSDAQTASRARSFAVNRLADCPDPKVKALRILTRFAREASRRPVGVPRSRFALLSAVFG